MPTKYLLDFHESIRFLVLLSHDLFFNESIIQYRSMRINHDINISLETKYGFSDTIYGKTTLKIWYAVGICSQILF